jgi:hypothetical protein
MTNHVVYNCRFIKICHFDNGSNDDSDYSNDSDDDDNANDAAGAAAANMVMIYI